MTCLWLFGRQQVIFPGKRDPITITFHPDGMCGTGVNIFRKFLHICVDCKKNGTANVGTPLVPMLDWKTVMGFLLLCLGAAG